MRSFSQFHRCIIESVANREKKNVAQAQRGSWHTLKNMYNNLVDKCDLNSTKVNVLLVMMLSLSLSLQLLLHMKTHDATDVKERVGEVEKKTHS